MRYKYMIVPPLRVPALQEAPIIDWGFFLYHELIEFSLNLCPIIIHALEAGVEVLNRSILANDDI